MLSHLTPPPDGPPTEFAPPPLLARLVASGVVPTDAWEILPSVDRDVLSTIPDRVDLANALAAHRLLTPFQAARLRAGAVAGLVLGNYRLLEKIGSGGMGVVFRAEHTRLRTVAAVKALYVNAQTNRRAVERFFQEIRAVTSLRHPNIVAAIDAGEEPAAGQDGQPVPYLVMEYIPGRNLDDLVAQDGPLGPARACQMAHQIADALTEAHRNGLIHRDIKPSNVIVTPDGRAKLLDFGVARLPEAEQRLTSEGTWLGTVGYIPPEQARDPRSVDERADVFGLGATLFFSLTGQDPFPPPSGAAAAIRPPSVLCYRSDAPPELDTVLARMMALNPSERTASAALAMRELAPFLGFRDAPASLPQPGLPLTVVPVPRPAGVPALPVTPPSPTHRILIVDDEESVRRVCRLALRTEMVSCDEVGTGPDAVERVLTHPYDLILLDMDLPGLNGDEVLRRIRDRPPAANIKVIMLSGRAPGDDLSRLMAAGAADFLTKPFSVVQLRSRVSASLRLKDAQDRSEMLSRRLATSNAELERSLTLRDADLVHARAAMVLALARLVGHRSAETGAHLIRLQRYCRVLAEAAAATPAFAERLPTEFVQAVEMAAPLHDIGKVAVPDRVLHKPGPLTPEERALMQTHTTIGADTLAGVSAQYPFATGFFHIAVEIARHHHEKWDGTGYPNGLVAEAIPLAARLIAVADVYDALRSPRVYKAGFTHEEASAMMTEKMPGHFDPALLQVFRDIAPAFDRVYREMAD